MTKVKSLEKMVSYMDPKKERLKSVDICYLQKQYSFEIDYLGENEKDKIIIREWIWNRETDESHWKFIAEYDVPVTWGAVYYDEYMSRTDVWENMVYFYFALTFQKPLENQSDLYIRQFNLEWIE